MPLFAFCSYHSGPHFVFSVLRAPLPPRPLPTFGAPVAGLLLCGDAQQRRPRPWQPRSQRRGPAPTRAVLRAQARSGSRCEAGQARPGRDPVPTFPVRRETPPGHGRTPLPLSQPGLLLASAGGGRGSCAASCGARGAPPLVPLAAVSVLLRLGSPAQRTRGLECHVCSVGAVGMACSWGGTLTVQVRRLLGSSLGQADLRARCGQGPWEERGGSGADTEEAGPWDPLSKLGGRRRPVTCRTLGCPGVSSVRFSAAPGPWPGRPPAAPQHSCCCASACVCLACRWPPLPVLCPPAPAGGAASLRLAGPGQPRVGGQQAPEPRPPRTCRALRKWGLQAGRV